MKKSKVLKKIMIICCVIIAVELILMFGMKIKSERNINRIDMLNHLEKVDGGYIGVGMSDFHNSKYVKEKNYDYKDKRVIQSSAKIAKLDDNYKVIWESSLNTDYDAIFYDVIEVNDGYLAVGSKVKNKDSIEENIRVGVLAKYDKNGNVLWDKSYAVLSNTEFYKIIDDGDGNYVVIGKSIYENLEMGNHITGGGIIVRYNSEGEVIAHNNYGGNKSGSFNDIIKVNDGYLVCGKDAANYGILVKFKKDFDRDENDNNLITKKVMWQRTYSNTDEKGFTGMVMYQDNIYLIGAINISNDKDSEGNIIFKYDAGIVSYNLNGKYLGKYSLGEEIHHRFNNVLLLDDKMYLTMQLDVDNSSKTEKQSSMIMTYKMDKDITKLGNNILAKKTFDYENNYIVNEINYLNNKLIYVGTSNNECDLYGCDYKSVIGEYK